MFQKEETTPEVRVSPGLKMGWVLIEIQVTVRRWVGLKIGHSVGEHHLSCYVVPKDK
jgi:hypothetical protein